MRRPAGALTGLVLTIALLVACDDVSDGGAQPTTPAPIVTASAVPSETSEVGGSSGAPAFPATSPTAPASKPGPDTPVSSTPGPIVTATAIPISQAPTAAAGRTLVLAPIEDVQVISTRSIPAQYVLTVGSGLPGGCAKYAGSTVEYRDAQVIVKIYNSMPTAPTACTAIYGFTTHNVPLGALTPGVVYEIRVNDRTIDLIAQ